MPDMLTAAAATTFEGSARLPIVRRERIRWSSLDSARRTVIRDATFAIVSTYYADFDRVEFEELFLAREGVVLALLYGPDDRLAGFCSTRRAYFSSSRHRYGVVSAGVYIDTRYRGGRVAAAFGLMEALRFKLLHPWLRVAYLGIAHTPAPYRLFTRTMPRVYPSRPGHSGEPPDEIAGVMRQALDGRGWPGVGGDPWVVATPMLSRNSQWLHQKSAMLDEPDVRSFVERVPGWARLGHALAVWIPLDLRDIVVGALRMLLRSKAR